MPPYIIRHPEFAKPRMVEADNPRRARAHTAKEFEVKRALSREIHELTQQGVELQDIRTKKD